MHKKAIIKSAIILTSANIITRVLGFFYRIYMSKTIGAEGMGLYQIITPLYLLIWAISSSGLSTTMSKLTAQEKAKGQQGNAEKILTISLIISVAIALCLSISVHNFAEEISQYIIKDKRTTLSLKWLSPCFPFMAAGSVIRGYFLGMQEAKVPAISQVIEQIVRMLAVYVLADTFVPMGLEYACGAAILGMALALTLTIIDTTGYNEAVVTMGGVDVDEIDPSTMESKIVKGMFFAGEIIDVDSFTGGFNLQIAFSTGYLAGINC